MIIAVYLFVPVNAAMAKLLSCMSPGSSVTKGGELRIVCTEEQETGSLWIRVIRHGILTSNTVYMCKEA